MIEIKTGLKAGDKVWWIHCSNRIYYGTIKEFAFCEGQGAVYCYIDSPTFKLNPYPTVHYTHCFSTKEEAKDVVKYLKEEEKHGMIRCDRCKFNEQYKDAVHDKYEGVII